MLRKGTRPPMKTDHTLDIENLKCRQQSYRTLRWYTKASILSVECHARLETVRGSPYSLALYRTSQMGNIIDFNATIWAHEFQRVSPIAANICAGLQNELIRLLRRVIAKPCCRGIVPSVRLSKRILC
jgi:hypothetical protein